MPARKPGRPRSTNPRTHAVAVTLTAAELAQLDAARGKQSRAAYVRASLELAAHVAAAAEDGAAALEVPSE